MQMNNDDSRCHHDTPVEYPGRGMCTAFLRLPSRDKCSAVGRSAAVSVVQGVLAANILRLATRWRVPLLRLLEQLLLYTALVERLLINADAADNPTAEMGPNTPSGAAGCPLCNGDEKRAATIAVLFCITVSANLRSTAQTLQSTAVAVPAASPCCHLLVCAAAEVMHNCHSSTSLIVCPVLMAAGAARSLMPSMAAAKPWIPEVQIEDCNEKKYHC